MYAEGTGVSPDPRRATALFGQACNGGNLSACNHLALALAEGIGVERSPTKAVEVYQKACDGGYKLACRNLGLHAARRPRRARRPRARRALLDKACKGGVPFACTNAGDLDAMLAAKGGAGALQAERSRTTSRAAMPAIRPRAVRSASRTSKAGACRSRPRAAAVWLERACMPDDPVACRVLGADEAAGHRRRRATSSAASRCSTRACDAKDDEACRMLKDADDAVTAMPASDGASDAGAAAMR